MKIAKISLETSYLDQNLKLFQQVFDSNLLSESEGGVSFQVGDCEISFKASSEPSLLEISLDLESGVTLQDFTKRIQFIFYSQFGEEFEPLLNLRQSKVSFYDFDGRMWHLHLRPSL